MECQIERKIIDMVERLDKEQLMAGKAREGDVKDIALVRIGVHCPNEAVSSNALGDWREKRVTRDRLRRGLPRWEAIARLETREMIDLAAMLRIDHMEARIEVGD